MSRLLGPLKSALSRLRYILGNWRMVVELGRVRTLNRRGEERASTVDQFHRLFYEATYSRNDRCSNPHWLGVEALKCPFDLWVYQEMLHELKPDLVIETGTAHGGSAYFLACVMDLLGKGQVLTIDITKRAGRPHHPRITYHTGSSTAPETLEEVRRRSEGLASVLVILDSDHRKVHVSEELRLLAPFVTRGSYLVVEDTNINGHPVFPSFGPGPHEAVEEFLQSHAEFRRDPQREHFLLTFNPGGFLRRH